MERSLLGQGEGLYQPGGPTKSWLNFIEKLRLCSFTFQMMATTPHGNHAIFIESLESIPGKENMAEKSEKLSVTKIMKRGSSQNPILAMSRTHSDLLLEISSSGAKWMWIKT